MADGLSISASIVMTLTIIFSLVSWFLFSWVSKSIKASGILLSVITAASLVIPFIQVLGPMAGIIIGVVAGFAAFMLQKTMINPAQNKPLIIATIIFVATYFVLILMILAFQTTSLWDTGDGIGEWTGTVEGIEHSSLGFDNLEISLNYFLSLIVLPTLIIAWIAIKDKTTFRGTINQYRYFFGIAFVTIGVAFFYNFLMLLVIVEFVMLQPDSSITTNQFFELVLDGIIQGISFHIIGIILIITGILIFKKRFVIIENEK